MARAGTGSSARAALAPATALTAAGPSEYGPVLVIAATWFEVAPLLARLAGESDHAGQDASWPPRRAGYLMGVPVVMVAGGVGKTNTAAAVTAMHAAHGPRAVLQLGIGGAYPTAGGGGALPLGSVAVASSEYDLDLGVGEGAAWRDLSAVGFPAVATDPPTFNRFPCHAALSRAVVAAVGCPLLPFATSDRVTAQRAVAERIAASVGAAVESMEGAAAAQVGMLLGLPFVEMRGLCNEVGERDKGAWRTREAIDALSEAALLALPRLSTV